MKRREWLVRVAATIGTCAGLFAMKAKPMPARLVNTGLNPATHPWWQKQAMHGPIDDAEMRALFNRCAKGERV